MLHYFDQVARSREQMMDSDLTTGRLLRSPSKISRNRTIEFPSGLGIEFQRTLRVPDNPNDDSEYPLRKWLSETDLSHIQLEFS